MWMITSASDRFIVTAYAGTAENGLYAAAYKIPTLLTYVVTIFNDAWKLSAVSESDDREQCANFYSQTYKYYIAVMFIGGGILSVGAQIFARVLFADSYYVAWVFIPVLSAATVFTALDTFLGSVYFTVKKTSMSLYTSLLGAVINLTLNLVMIPDWGLGWGAMGASVATFMSYFLVYVVRAATMGRFLRFKLYHGRLAVNTLLLCASVSLMTYFGLGGGKWCLFGAIGILLVGMVFNGRDLFLACKEILRSVLARKRR